MKTPIKKAAVKRVRATRPLGTVRTVRRTRPTISKREVHLLEGTMLGVFVLLIVSTLGLSLLGGQIIRSNESAAVESAVMVDLTNQNRVENNLQGLTIDPVLVVAAQEKANDEAAKSYFAHTSPEGLDSWHWFKQAGYNFTYAGENLAVDFSDSSAVVTAWMNSPEHRANILDSHYTQIGIATASGMYEGHPTIFVVQEFGRPADVAAAVAPIVQETQPTEPTQIAEATTQPASQPSTIATVPVSSQAPQVLGQTVKKPVVHVIATKPTAAAVLATEPTITMRPMLADSAPITLPLTSATALATAPVHYASTWDYFLVSPETTLRYAYYAIAFMVLVALLLTTGLEFRQHHLRHMAVAGGLLVAMCGLFLIADTVAFGHPSIAQSQAATIQYGS